MKEVTLKKLTLNNFKGKQLLEIDFSNRTVLSAENGCGKTRVYDAFLWLLTGRDSFDRFNHELMDNNTIYTQDNQYHGGVVGVLDIDGNEYILERIAKQKWVRNRGSEILTLSGFDYVYKIDSVEVNSGQYEEFVNSIVDKKTFKMITNTRYFTSLDPKEQRAMLNLIVGGVNDSDIQGDYSDIIREMNGTTAEQFKAKISNLKNPIKEQLNKLPNEIKGIESVMPTIEDWGVIETEITLVEKSVKDCDAELLGLGDKVKPFIEKRNTELSVIDDKKRELHNAKKDHDNEQMELPNKLATELNNIIAENKQIELRNNQSKQDHYSLQNEFNALTSRKAILVNKKAALLTEYSELNSKVFAADNCSYCGQELPADKLIELQDKFNDKKQSDINICKAEGVNITKEITDIDKRLAELNGLIQTGYSVGEEKGTASIEAQIINAKSGIIPFEQTVKYAELSTQIKELEQSITDIPTYDNTAIIERKKQHMQRLDELKDKLRGKQTIETSLNRIEQLNNEIKKASTELSRLEGLEFKAMALERLKSEVIQERVNKLFTTCQFKMFEYSKTEEIKDACEVYYNGVKFSVASNGEQQIIGLEIIKVISDFVGVKVPIWIDNAESITKDIICDSQTIELYAQKGQKELTVQTF